MTSGLPAASVPSVPTVRIDDNPAAGVVRATRELRASEIVAGWSGLATPGAVAFGTVMDGVLADTRAMAVVARLASPLAAAQRLVVLVPPLTWREVGFARAARVLKVLAKQIGVRITLVMAEPDAPEVEARFSEAKPDAPVRVEPVDDWRRAVRRLDGLVRSGDVLVLIGVRAGAVSWRPALQRLPRVLAQRHPTSNLLTLTLSEAEVVPLLVEAIDGNGREDLSLPPEHVTLDLAPAEPAALLRRVIAPGFPDTPSTAARLAEAIATEHADGSPEVMPGVVFYHMHTDEVDEPATFVGVCPRGVPLPQTGQPAQVVLALLAPKEIDPEAYLRSLAVTARLVRSAETVEALLAARTPEEAQGAVLGALRDDLAESSGDLAPA